MSQTVGNTTVWPLRTLPKDLGVALVTLAALLLGLLLRLSVEGGTKTYSGTNPSFAMSYPATWRTTDVTNTVVLRVENPNVESAYKTNVAVESRELDPASPPTLQALIDRRIVQHDTLTGYHLLSSGETTVNGARAAQTEYAFVEQPIDAPRRASLPVVVHSREYIVLAKDRVYYITLAAPENDFADAGKQFDSMIQTVKVQ